MTAKSFKKCMARGSLVDNLANDDNNIYTLTITRIFGQWRPGMDAKPDGFR
jgi:hypothetical protein